mmetsp:Transcript_46663/g.113696  ORF Transcript_46663/g.113696 Transcript_46663/m.113696 type:complete len:488 (+) Transcript_46663:899-2362(+)
MNERKGEVDQNQEHPPPLRQQSVSMSMSTTAKKEPATSCSLTSRCNCRQIELKIQFASTDSSTNVSGDVVPVDNDDCDDDGDKVFNCYCGPCRKFHTSAFVSTLRIEHLPQQQQQQQQENEQENEQQNIKIVSGNEYLMKYIYHPNDEENIDTTVATTKRRRHCPSSSSSSTSSTSSSTTVERWYCGICYTKLLSKTTTEESALTSSSQSSALPPPSSSTEPPPPPPTKSLYWINLGPIDETTISSRLASKWKCQLYDPKHNLNVETRSQWWNTKKHFPSQQSINDVTKKSSSTVDITTNIWTGQCSCGSCRYEIGRSSSPSPSKILTEQQHCSCNLCRDMSGQPFLSWMPIPQRDFRWTMTSTDRNSGKKKDTDDHQNHDGDGYDPSVIQKIQTSTFASRYLCRTCRGILMVIYHKQPDHVWLTIGSLDDTSLQPQHNTPLFGRSCHIFCKHKPSWWEIDNSNPDEPQFDEFDPDVCSSAELGFFY